MTNPFDKILQGGVPASNPFEKHFPAAEETGAFTEFTQGFSRGIDQTQALLVGGGAAALKYVGADDTGEEWMQDFREMQAEVESLPGAKIKKVEDITGISDFTNWAANALGENVPTILAILASGGIGGVIGAVAKKKGKDIALGELQRAALNGAGKWQYTIGTTALLGTGEVYGEQDENGFDNPGVALGAGALMGALDSFGATQIAKALGLKEGFNKEFLSQLAGLPKNKKVALLNGFSQGAVTEGATETMQELVALTARAYVDENFEVLGSEGASRLINAAAAGGLVGGTLGGVGGVLQEVGDQRAAEQTTPLEDLIRKPGSASETPALPAPPIYGRDERPQSPTLALPYLPPESAAVDAREMTLPELPPEMTSGEAARLVDAFGLPPTPVQKNALMDEKKIEAQTAVVEIARDKLQAAPQSGVSSTSISGDILVDHEALDVMSWVNETTGTRIDVKQTGKSFKSTRTQPDGKVKVTRHKSFSAVEKLLAKWDASKRLESPRPEPTLPANEKAVDSQTRETAVLDSVHQGDVSTKVDEASVEPEENIVQLRENSQRQLERDIKEALEAERDPYYDPDELYRRVRSEGLPTSEAQAAFESFASAFPGVQISAYYVRDGVTVTADGSPMKLTERAAGVSGFYRRSESRAYVNLSAHSDAESLQRTMVHEAIVHNGVWTLLSASERKALLAIIKRQINLEATADALQVDRESAGWQDRVAEEYLAHVAEGRAKWFDRVIAVVARAIRRVWKGVKVTNSELRLMVEDWAAQFSRGELNQLDAERLRGHFPTQSARKGEQFLYPVDSAVKGLRAFGQKPNGAPPLLVDMSKVLDLTTPAGQAAARAGRTGYSAMVGVDERVYVAQASRMRDPWNGEALVELEEIPQGHMSTPSQRIDILFREMDQAKRRRGPLSEKGRQAVRDIEGLMNLWKAKAARVFLTPQQIAQQANVAQVNTYMSQVETWWQDKMSTITDADDVMQEWRALGKDGARRVSEILFQADALSTDLGRRLNTSEMQRLYNSAGMTAEDIVVHESIRASFDRILDTLEVGIVDSYVKEQLKGQPPEQVQAALDAAREAPEKLEDIMAALTPVVGAENATALSTRIAEARRDMGTLRHRDYFPHTRFGQYTVTAYAKSAMSFEGKSYEADELVIFETAENPFEQQRRLKELRAELGVENFDYTIGKLQDQEFAFVGMPPGLISLMQQDVAEGGLGLSEKQAQALKEIVYKYSAGQRFLRSLTKRRGTAGYSKDAMRVYASYMTTAASHLARVKHNQDMQYTLDELTSISKGQDPENGNVLGDEQDLRSISELHSYFREHYDYIMNPGNEWARLRALGFMWYLGGNVKSAAVNLTQVPFVTYPWLAARYGDGRAVAAIANAMKDVAKGVREGGHLTNDELQAMEQGRMAGFIDESLATTLPGIAEGDTLQRAMPGETGSQLLNNVNYYGAFLFHHAEQYNRRAAFLAAYRLAREQGNKLGLSEADTLSSAYEEGKASVQSTMFEYAKWNRAMPMRGRASIVFLFMQYLQQAGYLAFGGHGAKTAIRYWLVLAAVAGLQGLPFADNLLDLVDVIDRQLGGEGQVRTDMREYINDVAWLPDADLVMHGATRKYGLGPLHALEALGVPIPNTDISGSIGMGGVIPGATASAELSSDPDAKLGKILIELGGPVMGIGYQMYRGLADDHPNTWKRFERMFPTALKNVSQGARWAQIHPFADDQGKVRMKNGAVVYSFEDTQGRAEAAAKMLGFAPTNVNQEWEKRGAKAEATKYWGIRRKLVYDNLWYMQLMKDREGLADARRKLRQFNKDVPFGAMRITQEDIRKSMKGRAIRKQLSEAGLPSRKDEVQLYRHIGSIYE